MGDSVPEHTGPISLTDTHLEPERLENPTDHHQRESSGDGKASLRKTLKLLAGSIVWRRTALLSSKGLT